MARRLMFSGSMSQLHAQPRVLVAEDHAVVLAALDLLIRSTGCETDAAVSVQAVRANLSARAYDLLLMDLNYARDTTSGREGLELLAEIHERDRTLPIIVMTGWGTIETAVEAMRLGARTFISKPWDNRVLADTIRREIEQGITLRQTQAKASRELQRARQIQQSLLPASLPRLASCEMAALWEPAAVLGGDCYDVRAFDENRFALSIADVAGKGLSAALLMSNLQALIRTTACDGVRPQDVTTLVNRSLSGKGDDGTCVTFFYGVLDTSTNTMTFTNGGHNPPILVRGDGSVERLATGGLLLGMFEDAGFDEAEVALRSGDSLLLFTDGITEAQDPDGVEFGDARLIDAIIKHRHDPAARIASQILDTVRSFAGGGLDDDATLLSVKIN
jgi:sigma-B regulation protein RsbU (phosphoserine phosphatase)